MKHAIPFIIIALGAISGCAPVYHPNVRNAPLFQGAGEFQGSVHFGNGIDFQGAVSVSDHIGLMANYSFTNRTSTTDEDQYVKHNLFEGGLGYYENSSRICYEFFAGYGTGEGTAYDNYDFISGSSTLRATGKYRRIFFQPSIGSNSRIFNWGFSARFSLVDFLSFEQDGLVYEPNHNNLYLFFEPAFVGKLYFGKSGIFTNFQAGFNLPAQGDPYFEYNAFHMSIGFGFRVGGTPASE